MARSGSAMLARCSVATLVTFFLASVTKARLDSSAFLSEWNKRFLEELGMEGFPDMRMVNTSKEHLQSMTRKYWNRVAHSEGAHLLTSQACSNDALVFNLVDIEDAVQWARLRFLNSSAVGLPLSIFGTRTRNLLTLPCSQCCGAILQLQTTPGQKTRSTRQHHHNENCHRHSLIVNFKDIGWNWVVEPQENNVFYCEGSCAGMDSGQLANTHALLQTMVNVMTDIGRLPCCAPVKFKPLEFLHYNNSTPPRLVLTRLEGAIVEQCACD